MESKCCAILAISAAAGSCLSYFQLSSTLKDKDSGPFFNRNSSIALTTAAVACLPMIITLMFDAFLLKNTASFPAGSFVKQVRSFVSDLLVLVAVLFPCLQLTSNQPVENIVWFSEVQIILFMASILLYFWAVPFSSNITTLLSCPSLFAIFTIGVILEVSNLARPEVQSYKSSLIFIKVVLGLLLLMYVGVYCFLLGNKCYQCFRGAGAAAGNGGALFYKELQSACNGFALIAAVLAMGACTDNYQMYLIEHPQLSTQRAYICGILCITLVVVRSLLREMELGSIKIKFGQALSALDEPLRHIRIVQDELTTIENFYSLPKTQPVLALTTLMARTSSLKGLCSSADHAISLLKAKELQYVLACESHPPCASAARSAADHHRRHHNSVLASLGNKSLTSGAVTSLGSGSMSMLSEVGATFFKPSSLAEESEAMLDLEAFYRDGGEDKVKANVAASPSLVTQSLQLPLQLQLHQDRTHSVSVDRWMDESLSSDQIRITISDSDNDATSAAATAAAASVPVADRAQKSQVAEKVGVSWGFNFVTGSGRDGDSSSKEGIAFREKRSQSNQNYSSDEEEEDEDGLNSQVSVRIRMAPKSLRVWSGDSVCARQPGSDVKGTNCARVPPIYAPVVTDRSRMNLSYSGGSVISSDFASPKHSVGRSKSFSTSLSASLSSPPPLPPWHRQTPRNDHCLPSTGAMYGSDGTHSLAGPRSPRGHSHSCHVTPLPLGAVPDQVLSSTQSTPRCHDEEEYDDEYDNDEIATIVSSKSQVLEIALALPRPDGPVILPDGRGAEVMEANTSDLDGRSFCSAYDEYDGLATVASAPSTQQVVVVQLASSASLPVVHAPVVMAAHPNHRDYHHHSYLPQKQQQNTVAHSRFVLASSCLASDVRSVSVRGVSDIPLSLGIRDGRSSVDVDDQTEGSNDYCDDDAYSVAMSYDYSRSGKYKEIALASHSQDSFDGIDEKRSICDQDMRGGGGGGERGGGGQAYPPSSLQHHIFQGRRYIPPSANAAYIKTVVTGCQMNFRSIGFPGRSDPIDVMLMASEFGSYLLASKFLLDQLRVDVESANDTCGLMMGQVSLDELTQHTDIATDFVDVVAVLLDKARSTSSVCCDYLAKVKLQKVFEESKQANEQTT